MQITILGSGTGFPRKERAAPGILVKIDRSYILLDAGPGSMRQLAMLGLTTNDIDMIFFTHFHPDHTLGLIEFLFCAKYQVVSRYNLPQAVKRFVASGGHGFRTKPLKLIGPVGLKMFYRQTKRLYGKWITSPNYRLCITEVKDAVLRFNGWQIKSTGVMHAGNSVAYRVESGDKSFVYSGDTIYCPSLVKLSLGANLLILECSTSDEIYLPGHLTPASIGRIAREANAKRIILTHIYEVAEKFNLLRQVQKVWKGNVTLARDLMRVKL